VDHKVGTVHWRCTYKVMVVVVLQLFGGLHILLGRMVVDPQALALCMLLQWMLLDREMWHSLQQGLR